MVQGAVATLPILSNISRRNDSGKFSPSLQPVRCVSGGRGDVRCVSGGRGDVRCVSGGGGM